MISEVLSPGNTEDTWESIRACAPLPTLQEIVAVESERVEVQIFRRDANGVWSGEPEIIGAGGTLRLARIDLALPISDVYAGTHLAECFTLPKV